MDCVSVPALDVIPVPLGHQARHELNLKGGSSLKMRIASLSLLALCLTLAAVPAMAQGTVYDNGPVNGQVDAWTINFGFAVSDTFHTSSSATLTYFDFWAWVEPGDIATSVEVAISAAGYFGNELFAEPLASRSRIASPTTSASTFARNLATSAARPLALATTT
jgi:hypothetical protein